MAPFAPTLPRTAAPLETYRQSFDGFEAKTKNNEMREFYMQVSIYTPSYYLTHNFLTSGGRLTSVFNHPKLFIIQEPDQSFDVGELVATRYEAPNSEITMYRVRSSTGLADHFITSSPTKWNSDGWTTVEVYANLDTQTVRMWAAHTGEPPVLQFESVGNADLGGVNTPTGRKYSGVQLVPRINSLVSDSSRQNTFVAYDELIVSTQAINFPGGYTLNGGGTGPSVTLTASEEEVGSGSSVDLSWSSDGTSCSASGDWTGSKGTSGSETVGPLTSDATYTLTCSNNDGSTSRSVSVDVVGTPTLSFSANPTSVVAGGNSVLSWSTTDASSCSAQDGWSGTKGASGSETVGPLNADTMFTLTCSGAGGSVSDSVTVTTDGDPGDPAEFVDEGFDGYSDGADPTGWLDTAGGNGLSEDDQFEVLTVSGDKAFGTTNVNSTNIHSHYSVSGSSVWTNYEYSGRMQITGANDGIGVTAFSDYPDSDSYYRLRREGQDSGTFKISTHGSGLSCVGQTDTGVFPATDIWYLFRLQAEDLGGETEVRAKVWQEGSAEPAQWQATCSDTGTRRTMGKVGLWAVVAGVDSGTKYWDDLQVTSLAASGSAPTLSFSADPSSVGDQGTTTLTWSAGNADSCTASGSWSGSRSATGSETVGPLGSTSTFELMCSNNFGNVTRTVTVTVQAGAPAPTMSFSADPSVVDAGDSTTLDWSSANADSCSASGGWSGPKATSGSESVGPINSDTTFTQTCSGPGGSLTQSVVVSAMQPNPPPNDPPSANNSSGGGGGMGWQSLAFVLAILGWRRRRSV